ncbi:MAG: 16S rRNA (adenine(1518)-N(6)/adenine(1519)-N(6))-dimethyltransferase RsmA [Sulfuricaulis sp.]|uniref:16S rRNA (adenine(1518)-N(6)/adenine(1519)-N(6))- dimethyltransferase RsmA n=1 Tax=Sulfuricaulis sp. TaxID=2003553 RepID=UPI0026008458|nr:16S rRNA (adenine(1518)-N(6)/adenine(1519)-N(6))-dimethyltransferase RsmA [Sulfuricaulis sp.]MCR4346071.1 16S rRNA (adenine(1518)-N(6)/adenine(1519)-N(6))-dimethyltransferase RsmA [Sulfuricaulis sp.]
MYHPKKRFGQHFLHDRHVIGRIVAALAPRPDDHVVEIGPGKGALTRELAAHLAHFDAVELDRDLLAHLPSIFPPDKLTLHGADALEYDFCQLVQKGRKLRLVGNLPYNISTPLLFHLLDQAHCIQDMLFMLQKEVVQRLAASPGGKDYGRLSVMIQYRCRVEKLFDVAPGSFTPPPKVDSAMVRLVPLATPPVAINDEAQFARVVRAAFASRRKTLRNNMKGLLSGDDMTALGIDPIRRAETLTLAEFAALSNATSSAP